MGVDSKEAQRIISGCEIMLRHLVIKNFALIESLEVTFEAGLNVLTGETGAGKSIILQAIHLLIGERAESDMIRSGSTFAQVEGLFDLTRFHKKHLSDPIAAYLKGEELLIKREINQQGKNKCLVNGELVALTELKKIGNHLIDLHGQHEHQSLLRPESHLEFLDRYGKLDKELELYQEQYGQWRELLEQIFQLEQAEKQYREKKEFYEFQYQEIEKAQLSESEETDLLQQISLLTHAEKIHQSAHQIGQVLGEDEAALLARIGGIKKEIDYLAKMDGRCQELEKLCENGYYAFVEIERFIRDYRERIEFDPQKLETLQGRLDFVQRLKKKYQKTIPELLAYLEQLRGILQSVEGGSQNLENLKNQSALIEKRVKLDAEEISKKRQRTAKEVIPKMGKIFNRLGMEEAIFKITFDKKALDGSGVDGIEFYISTNAGEPPKPLVKVASGGELSRIMLSLKSVFADVEQVPLMVFDEIDAGIGGRVAHAVGEAIKTLSQTHQIICITHLQQIAARADGHFAVTKEKKNDRVVTLIERLSEEQTIQELARMIGGKESKLSLEHALELKQGGGHR